MNDIPIKEDLHMDHIPTMKTGSSGVAKAALATAIPAAALSVLDWVKEHKGGHNNAVTSGSQTNDIMAAFALAQAMNSHYGHGEHREDRHVNRYEMDLIRETTCKDTEIAELKAEKYADNKIACAVEKLTVKIEKVEENTEKSINFINEKFSDGFSKLAAKYGELKIDMDSNFIRADKVLDKKHINYGLPCPGMGYKPDEGRRNHREQTLAELIESGSITGTLTLGAATVDED